MLQKAQASLRRGFMAAKGHAAEMYRTGRSILNKVDYGYNIFKKLHGVVSPALADYPAAAKATKHAMSSYEQTRNKVLGTHSDVEKIVSAVRARVPELGL